MQGRAALHIGGRTGCRPRWPSRTATLVDGLPSESAAGALRDEIRQAFGQSAEAERALVAQRLPSGVRIEIEKGHLRACWGWLRHELRVDDEALVLTRRFAQPLRLDADDIEDFVLRPSPTPGRMDLVASLKKGRSQLLLGADDPPGFAEHLLDDLRRVLRIER